MRRRKRPQPERIAEGVVLALTGIAYGGEAIGRHEGVAVFVGGAIPGEEVKVDLFRERKGILRGELREVLGASTDRVVAPCPYFGYCGGCQWQHISYEQQLALKARTVTEQLQRIGGFADPPVRPTLPSPRDWYYRNNVRFSTGRHGHLGFNRPGSHRFLAIDHCLISHWRINDVLAQVQGQGEGLHQVVMRVGEGTGDFLLYPALPLGNDERISHDHLEDVLLGHRFYISLSSFFQVNTLQAERLASIAIDRLMLSGHEVVVDAYSGVGTFAILLANRVAQVIGIEESRSAINDAKRNLAGVENVDFIQGKTEEVLPRLGKRVDAAILDPARAGCAREVIEALATLRPARMVYVSCDPSTLARDLRMICDRGYELIEVQPVDMFPQTYHIETVATLNIRAADG